MDLKDIANRITGFSIPIFGLSWNPPKLEKDIAERVINHLEDRRVLYNPYELEVPRHCVESVLKIREFLTEQLCDVYSSSVLGETLRAMRDACRGFLDLLTRNSINVDQGLAPGLGDQMVFFSCVGELRALFSVLVAKLLVTYKIERETVLVRLLPTQYLDE